MKQSDVATHISQQFNEELEEIRHSVLSMGGLVEQQLADAVTALLSLNPEIAELVIENDTQINELELKIDEECTKILALRQPTASDLRLVIAVFRIITDLERMGDEAAKVARMGLDLSLMNASNKTYLEMENITSHVIQMVNKALDSFARMDADTALQTARIDKRVDREYEAITRQLITLMMEDSRNVRHFIDVIWAARAIERIGDHARNICEQVIYIVQGTDIRHSDIIYRDRSL